MSISLSLKKRAKRKKVRITFDNAFGERKMRSPGAITKEIKASLRKSHRKTHTKSPTKSPPAKKPTESHRKSPTKSHRKSPTKPPTKSPRSHHRGLKTAALLLAGGVGLATLADRHRVYKNQLRRGNRFELYEREIEREMQALRNMLRENNTPPTTVQQLSNPLSIPIPEELFEESFT